MVYTDSIRRCISIPYKVKTIFVWKRKMLQQEGNRLGAKDNKDATLYTQWVKLFSCFKLETRFKVIKLASCEF